MTIATEPWRLRRGDRAGSDASKRRGGESSGRVASRAQCLDRKRPRAVQTSSDATIVASTDPLSEMYFEISLAVSFRSAPGSQRRLSSGTRSNMRPFLNNLTSTTRTEHRASLRKWKMSVSRR